MQTETSPRLQAASTNAREFFTTILENFPFGEEAICEIIDDTEYKEAIIRASNATLAVMAENSAIFVVMPNHALNMLQCSFLNMVKILEHLGIIKVERKIQKHEIF